MATKYSLLIDQDQLNVKAIGVIRKRTGLAMGEIRRRAAEGEPVHECGATDNNGIALIISTHRDLESAEITNHVLRGDREVGAAYLVSVLRERREDIIADGEESLYEDEPWFTLSLG